MKNGYLLIAMLLLFGTAAAANPDPIMSSFPVLDVSLLSQSPDPVMAGGIVTVRLNVQNTGASEANNIRIGLDYNYPFSAVPGEETNYTILSLPRYPDDYSSTTLEFKIKVDPNVTAGEYELGIIRGVDNTGKTVEGNPVSTTWEAGSLKEVTLRVTGEEFADIRIDKTSIVPGEETPVTFTITNTGNAPLQNLIFSWDEDGGMILPVGSDNTRQIKQLAVGESIDLNYIVSADLDTPSGLYDLELNLQYQVIDNTGTYVSQNVERYVGMIVGGETDFDLTFSESSDEQTSFSIANIGNNPALAVAVRIPEQDGYSVSGSSASIVGNLDSGDYTIVSFQVSQAATATISKDSTEPPAHTHTPLTILIEYTDTTGSRHSIEKSIFITQTDMPAATGTGMRHRPGTSFNYWWLAIPFLALIGYVAYCKKTGRKILANPLKKKKK